MFYNFQRAKVAVNLDKVLSISEGTTNKAGTYADINVRYENGTTETIVYDSVALRNDDLNAFNMFIYRMNMK